MSGLCAMTATHGLRGRNVASQRACPLEPEMDRRDACRPIVGRVDVELMWSMSEVSSAQSLSSIFADCAWPTHLQR